MSITIEQALRTASAIKQRQAIVTRGNKPTAISVILQTGNGMRKVLLGFAVVCEVADGDGIAAVAVGKQTVVFVDRDTSCRRFKIKQTGLLQTVHVDDGQFWCAFIADEGVTRRGIHVKELLHDGFRGEGFAVSVSKVERYGAEKCDEGEQVLFHE